MRASSHRLLVVALLCCTVISITAASCPAGQYDTSKCTPCPSGYYCPGGTTAPKTTCPYGYYCPAGSSSPQNRYKGVNLSFGGNEPSNIPGKHGTNYIYPTTNELDYFSSKGMKVIRIGFSIGRMQPVTNGPLATGELNLLTTAVQQTRAKGMISLFDPHNYGQMWDAPHGNYSYIGISSPTYTAPSLPASAFGDFWGKMAQVFGTQSDVWFGLMNEPHVHTAQQWYNVATVAVSAIRAAGATNKILIPGTSWTGAHSWISSGNAGVWQNFQDSNFAFELHQYLDSDSSGTHTDCTVGRGYSSLVAATNWARARNVELFLGEFGWADNSQCTTEATTFVNYMTNSSDVWLGWTWWSAGAWWGDYMYSVEPASFTKPITDKPQMGVLLANVLPDVAPTTSSSSTAASTSSSSTAQSSTSTSTSTATSSTSTTGSTLTSTALNGDGSSSSSSGTDAQLGAAGEVRAQSIILVSMICAVGVLLSMA